VVVAPYADLDDVVDAINNDPGGLVTYLYGADIRRLTDRAGRIACGSIGINTHQVVGPRYPFAGWRDSGLGHELGPDGVRAFQRPRHVMTRSPAP
jgi:aldehyde dehydrogenase (NAD+)